MIPAAPRRMGHPSSHAQICTAAPWTNCHCPRCRPDLRPSSAPVAPDAAARVSDPLAAGGGNSLHTPGALAVPPENSAADRPLTPFNPIGGPLCQEQGA